MMRLVIAIILSTHSVAEKTETRWCAPAAVAAYSSLRGTPCSYESAVTQFRRRDPSCNLARVSLSEICGALNDFGQDAILGKVDPKELARVPLPFIAYLPPAPGFAVGHTIAISEVRQDRLLLIDETQLAEPTWVPIGDFTSEWKGDFIVSRSQLRWSSAMHRLWSTASWGGLVVCFVAACHRYVLRTVTSGKLGVKAASLAAMLSVLLSGCTAQVADSASAALSPGSVNLGLVDLDNEEAGQGVKSAEFLVTSPGQSVRVIDVKPACSCTVAKVDAFPASVPAEGLPITVDVDLNGRVGPFESFIEVVTDAPTGANLFANVSAVVLPRSKLSVNRLYRFAIGDSTEVTIVARVYRSDTMPVPMIKSIRTNFGQLPDFQVKTEEVEKEGSVVSCNHTITFSPTSQKLAIGNYPFKIELSLSNDKTLTFDSAIEVRHPFEINPDVFLGTFKRGLPKGFSVPFKSSGRVDLNAISVTGVGQGLTVNLKDSAIELELTEAAAGKSERLIELRFADDTLPAIPLRISGYVVEN